jgi:hypothetical protein
MCDVSENKAAEPQLNLEELRNMRIRYYEKISSKIDGGD